MLISFYCIGFMLALTVNSFSAVKALLTRQASLSLSFGRLSDFLLSRKTKQYDDVWWCFNSYYETNLLRFRQLVVTQNLNLCRRFSAFTLSLAPHHALVMIPAIPRQSKFSSRNGNKKIYDLHFMSFSLPIFQNACWTNTPDDGVIR